MYAREKCWRKKKLPLPAETGRNETVFFYIRTHAYIRHILKFCSYDIAAFKRRFQSSSTHATTGPRLSRANDTRVHSSCPVLRYPVGCTSKPTRRSNRPRRRRRRCKHFSTPLRRRCFCSSRFRVYFQRKRLEGRDGHRHTVSSLLHGSETGRIRATGRSNERKTKVKYD